MLSRDDWILREDCCNVGATQHTKRSVEAQQEAWQACQQEERGRGQEEKQEEYVQQGESEKGQSLEEGASQGWQKEDQGCEKYSYHWCKHHMSWIVHLPAECHLGKQHMKEQNKPKPSTTVCANAATYAAATTTQVNPHFQAMLAALASDDKE
jgi:hypothetical protein